MHFHDHLRKAVERIRGQKLKRSPFMAFDIHLQDQISRFSVAVGEQQFVYGLKLRILRGLRAYSYFVAVKQGVIYRKCFYRVIILINMAAKRGHIQIP